MSEDTNLSEFTRAKLEHLFGILDANGDGALEVADLDLIVDRLAGIRGYGSESRERETLSGLYHTVWKELLRFAETNSSGRISLDDYYRYYADVLGSDRALRDKLDAGDAWFEILDADGDGAIVKDELGDFHAAYGIPREVSAAIFDAIDSDSAGRIGRDRFAEVLRDFFTSDDPENPAVALFGKPG
jgi:Ca2+-binding EF-hand superfamily protein